MNCSFCRRRARGEQLPRAWKIFGRAVFCPQCRRRRYRLRSITMAVAEPIGAGWEELHSALENSCIHAAHCEGAWEASIEEGHPVVHVVIGDRPWKLRLKRAAWCSAKRVAYEAISSGAAAGELFLYSGPTGRNREGSGSDSQAHAEAICCRMVAWLPRKRIEDVLQEPLPVRGSQFAQCIPDLDETDIRSWRDGIGAKRVTLPSQLPMLPRQNQAGHPAT
jgi:hypothetical protein